MSELIKGESLIPKKIQSENDLRAFLHMCTDAVALNELIIIKNALVISLNSISAHQYGEVKSILRGKLQAFIGDNSLLSADSRKLLRLIISSGSYGRILVYLNRVITECVKGNEDKSDITNKSNIEMDYAHFAKQTDTNISKYLDLLAIRIGRDAVCSINKLIKGRVDYIYMVSRNDKFLYRLSFESQTRITRADEFMKMAFFDEELKHILQGDFFVLEVL